MLYILVVEFSGIKLDVGIFKCDLINITIHLHLYVLRPFRMYNCLMGDSARGESLLSQAILEVQPLWTNLITPPHSTIFQTTSTEPTSTYSPTTSTRRQMSSLRILPTWGPEPLDPPKLSLARYSRRVRGLRRSTVDHIDLALQYPPRDKNDKSRQGT